MPSEKSSTYDAIILLAKGYDERFVGRCIGDFREAGIRTHLVGLRSQYVKSLHGVEMQTDKVLKNWKLTDDVNLVVIPGQAECVGSLAREPMVSERVGAVLKQGGAVAAAYSAESTLKQQQDCLPSEMCIVPTDIDEEQYFPQRDAEDIDFIQTLIRRFTRSK